MPIFARSSAHRQEGFTLFELLIALSILSFGVLLSVNAFRAYSPRIAVEHAAGQLVADLKRARLHAKQTGEDVTVSTTETGYAITPLSVRRESDELRYSWTGEPGGIVFTRRFSNLGGRIEISKGRRRAVVVVHAITGKVERFE